MISWIYGKITDYRNTLYEKGALKSFSLGVLTVSIGNITVGGTGKTPLVAFVAETIAARGEKVCILTRGYGRRNAKQRVLVSDGEKVLANAGEAGDEPLELAQKLRGKAVVVADANRVAAGNWARGKFGVTAFVLDDAFQHRKVERHLDIVAVDATNPFGNEKSLPSGILRESLKHLKRAGVIVITRANLVANLDDLRSQISDLNNKCPIFVCENKIANLIDLNKFPEGENRQITKKKCLAFCALGNPENFFEQLRRENFDLVSTRAFPDHHFYTPADVAGINNKAKESGAEVLLTTAKDAVKLKDISFDLPCFVVENRLVFDDEAGFRKLLNAAESL